MHGLQTIIKNNSGAAKQCEGCGQYQGVLPTEERFVRTYERTDQSKVELCRTCGVKQTGKVTLAKPTTVIEGPGTQEYASL